jgi:MscS family membrane protein
MAFIRYAKLAVRKPSQQLGVALKGYLHRSRPGIFRYVLLTALLSLGAVRASPQAKRPLAKATHAVQQAAPSPAPTPQAPAPTPPPEPLGRLTPYGCVLGFLRAAEAKDFEKAGQYLDGKRPPEETKTLAFELKYLLDQGLSTSIDSLSRSPTGELEDNLRMSRELVGIVVTPTGELRVLLDLVKRQDQPSIWLFSQETLNQVPATYAGMQHTDYADWFPAWTSRFHIFSVPLWRWGLILVSIILVFGVASLLSRIGLWLLRQVFEKRLSIGIEGSVIALRLPVFLLTVAILERLAGEYAITALGKHYWKTAGLVLAWISSAWLVVRIAGILSGVYRDRLMLRMQVERATFVNLLARLFNILVVLILVVALLSHAGVNISALITGLGIGGVAIALAAQKTLADLFGGLSIIMRGAVRVGDFCQIAGISGTVEDIGISSLRLRTLDRSVVSIPNSKVAEANLENFALRDQFWIHQTFTLRFDTPHDVTKIVIDRIIAILKAHPEIDASSARARLINLTASGPQIEVFAYFSRSGANWSVFLVEQEGLLLKMIAAVESAGTSMAAPVGVLRMDTEKKTDSGNQS